MIITRRNASEILVSQDGSGWTLPRLAIRPRQRVAEQLVSELNGEWGIETYCLFAQKDPTLGRTGDATKCAVMESVRHNDKAPAGTYWMPPFAAADCRDVGEAAAIRESLDDLDSYVRGEKTGPFARPGWLRELFRWTEEQVAPLGLRLTGGFRQWNASPTFSLVRLETNDGALWFKATGEPNSHELPVSLLLSRRFPGHVPRVLGAHPSWNGWLSAEASGIALDEISDCSAWERVAEALAELQIRVLPFLTRSATSTSIQEIFWSRLIAAYFSTGRKAASRIRSSRSSTSASTSDAALLRNRQLLSVSLLLMFDIGRLSILRKI